MVTLPLFPHFVGLDMDGIRARINFSCFRGISLKTDVSSRTVQEIGDNWLRLLKSKKRE
jgi:hypothetical protein